MPKRHGISAHIKEAHRAASVLALTLAARTDCTHRKNSKSFTCIRSTMIAGRGPAKALAGVMRSTKLLVVIY
jgi:hypothetical protein